VRSEPKAVARIKRSRKLAGLSQGELAAKSGVTRSRLAAFEAGYFGLHVAEMKLLEVALRKAMRAVQVKLIRELAGGATRLTSRSTQELDCDLPVANAVYADREGL